MTNPKRRSSSHRQLGLLRAAELMRVSTYRGQSGEACLAQERERTCEGCTLFLLGKNMLLQIALAEEILDLTLSRLTFSSQKSKLRGNYTAQLLHGTWLLGR